MPLIVLCGLPCSGKSTIAKKLVEKLEAAGIEILVKDETAVAPDRNAAYKDSRSEKMTRGMLKASAERSLRGERVVVLDALNNIKGYRYELWCLAKANKARYCLVHCELSVEVSREWNKSRTEGAYIPEIFEDLASRFESPDTRNRWDVPLFRINPLSESIDAQLDAVIAAITGSEKVTAGGPVAKTLEPNIATQNTDLSRTNLLNELDSDAQEVVNSIMAAQGEALGNPVGEMTLGDASLHLDRLVGLPELRRHKRAFIRLATQNNWTRLQDVQEAQRMFLEYLEQNI